MSYGLREHVSFCNAEGRLVFLDIREDRYFRLPDHLERGLLAYLDDGCKRSLVLETLVEMGVLVRRRGKHDLIAPVPHPPARSAMELSTSTSKTRPTHIARAASALLSTRVRLKTSSLQSTLRQLVVYRYENAPSAGSAADTEHEQPLLQATAAFMHVRGLVSKAGSCLPDSIALARFLASEGLPVDVVFGVTGVPFSAHCWAQSGDIVLNDAIGNVQAHTPILVI
jgi:hypothetical protein